MQHFQSFLLFVMGFLVSSHVSRALDCVNPNKVVYTVTVSRSGGGNFTKIQDAIDNSIPPNNNQWIRIQISTEKYLEKITIPANKPCIFLEGGGLKKTIIEWADHESTVTSATFTSLPDNIVAQGITFKNTYNVPPSPDSVGLKQAVVARIAGDKTAFYGCHFVGVQDTLLDQKGRHYFCKCYIEGVVDFIFGNGQSIYERCVINSTIREYLPDKSHGYITAQGRNSSKDPSGFVFKYCLITGSGKTYLGRAYRGYSRVIFVKSTLTDVVVPEGWDAWSYVNHEENIEYIESDCNGAGANTSKRVAWEKKMSADQLSQFVNIAYIDKERWIAKLPLF